MQQEMEEQLDSSRSPVYYQEQIDQMILAPETRSNVIVRKKPKLIKKPVYALNEKNEKIPLQDSEGNPVVDDKGEQQYLIKEYKLVQNGWTSVMELVPASEIFNVDNSTSNISQEAVFLLLRTMWWHNRLSTYQVSTKEDYSLYLHNVRNDAIAILQSAKSYRGGTVQAIKTFINKTDSKQWQAEQEPEEKKGMFSPLTSLLGGTKKKKIEEDKKYTAFQ